ncbi:MAG: hypothetical protein HYT37_00440 [Candidatus Sungbacteria bacterium]|nr:hypothetical protein [Candidatus Sungbacteria bacterium]
MNSLQDANISEEDLDKASERISAEAIKFFPWDCLDKRVQEVAKLVIKRGIRRKLRELFGKPLPAGRMISPRKP